MATQEKREHWTPLWGTAVATLAAVVVVVAEQARLVPFQAWALPFVAVGGAFATVLATAVQGAWVWAYVVRVAAWLVGGAWTTWASYVGWTQPVWLTLAVVPLTLAAFGFACRSPVPVDGSLEQAGQGVIRNSAVAQWQADVRAVLRRPVTVDRVVSWPNPRDGEQVYVHLPVGTTWRHLHDLREELQGARQLPAGCVIHVLEGEHQGVAVLDVMLRDCLAGSATLGEQLDMTSASINDPFPVFANARGEQQEICLRRDSMVVGGAPDAGKTTLLHRIIMWLARCPDVLIWVVDMNGGGLADSWITPWLEDRASKPIVDWVAACEDEAAALTAAAEMIAKDRKTSPEARRRRREQDTRLLPVDHELPAILILTDEGGEVRQAASVFGRVACDRISQIAQIGRAEAVRVVMSVIRGTADLLDKGLRVCAPIRICLRMIEDDEYSHVLGVYPGRTRLTHIGQGWLSRVTDARPILGRSIDVPPSLIDDAAVAYAHLRPDLDDRAKRVVARIRPGDIIRRDPVSAEMRSPVMRDALAGVLYERRWDRYRDRVDDLSDDALEQQPVEEPPSGAMSNAGEDVTDAVADLVSAVEKLNPGWSTTAREQEQPRGGVNLANLDAVNAEFERLAAQLAPGQSTGSESAGKLTAREHILAILDEVFPQPLTSHEIGEALRQCDVGVQGEGIARTYRQDLLAKMREATEIVRLPDGRYTVAKDGQR